MIVNDNRQLLSIDESNIPTSMKCPDTQISSVNGDDINSLDDCSIGCNSSRQLVQSPASLVIESNEYKSTETEYNLEDSEGNHDLSSCNTSVDPTSLQFVLENPNSLEMEEWDYCYVDRRTQIKYPKHPYTNHKLDFHNSDYHKYQNNCDSKAACKCTTLMTSSSEYLEPCQPQLSSDELSQKIEIAIKKRLEFLARDPTYRATIVYESLSKSQQNDVSEQFLRYSSEGASLDSRENTITSGSSGYFPYEAWEANCDDSSPFPKQNALTFDSNFESGNLKRAIRIGMYEYDLILHSDINTSNHMQWFYFAVSNITKWPDNDNPLSNDVIEYRFNIVNLLKCDSLFNQGLQPVIYSFKDAHDINRGWQRAGENILYFSNLLPRQSNASTYPQLNRGEWPAGERGGEPELTQDLSFFIHLSPNPTYYTLSFTLKLSNANDTYLIAHSYPYTVSDNLRHLQSLLYQKPRSNILKHSILCRTLGGRSCDLLTISDFKSKSAKDINNRKCLFFTARVHPGESQSSYMMKGLINFLLSDSSIAIYLRENFVMQVIPMLNPDGVYFGNTRCGLAACDLNRQWIKPSETAHPTIYHTKRLLTSEHTTRGVLFFCDMHGHSRKKNVFMFGCDTRKKPNPIARIFPKALSSHNEGKHFFSLADCSYNISRGKETTGRVVVARELDLPWSFTLEASFCGANFGELKGIHFNTQHLETVGKVLGETLLQACFLDSTSKDHSSRLKLHKELRKLLPKNPEKHWQQFGILTEKKDKSKISGRLAALSTVDLIDKQYLETSKPKLHRRNSAGFGYKGEQVPSKKASRRQSYSDSRNNKPSRKTPNRSLYEITSSVNCTPANELRDLTQIYAPFHVRVLENETTELSLSESGANQNYVSSEAENCPAKITLRSELWYNSPTQRQYKRPTEMCPYEYNKFNNDVRNTYILDDVSGIKGEATPINKGRLDRNPQGFTPSVGNKTNCSKPRFRGAGKQFVSSPLTKGSSIISIFHDIDAKYESNLLKARTIPIRERAQLRPDMKPLKSEMQTLLASNQASNLPVLPDSSSRFPSLA